jgi:PRC-barrel domain protein
VDDTAIYNRNGDRLGSIDHLMIDKVSGQVEYAVMSCGGFLGIGESYNPVPCPLPPRQSGFSLSQNYSVIQIGSNKNLCSRPDISRAG